MLFSIIIPIYNAEKYLPECLDSIVSQVAIEHCEIILINDGSSDASAEIANSYSQKYSYISIIHQKNQGVSAARNQGLINANGQYLVFIDSDDILLDDFFFKLIPTLADSPDIIEFDAERIDSNGKMINKSIFYRDIKNIKIEELKDSKNRFSKEAQYYLWGRVIRKDNIANHFFNENISYCEDALYLTECYYQAKYIKTISCSLYRYRQHGNNITADKTHKNVEELNILIKFIISHIHSLQDTSKKTFYLNLLVNMVHLRKSMNVLLHNSFVPDKETYNQIKIIKHFYTQGLTTHPTAILALRRWSLRLPRLTNILILIKRYLQREWF